ncbi:SLC13 family permease [Raoultibacter phocaeensis]|uniref:SLC13 family permease n=1 Tax=Raoultibacter phocaeensis TaxID=2479841 RepID=UPI00111B85DC|nr:SLC13 family permease [Raoultibacter phocaeensis]
MGEKRSAKSNGASNTKRVVCIGIAIVLVLAAWATPTPEGLGEAGKMSLALMVAGIFLWVTEPVPVAISGLVVMILMPVFGILEFNAGVWSGFISSVIFFIMASFGITAALLKTKIPTKIVFTLMHLTKGNSRATVLAFMIAASVLSFFISDLPCTALFAGIAVSSILEIEGCEKGSSNLGKALMIGITYASVVGGQAIPSGSAMNIMAMNVLEANTGIAISFLDWTLICLPIALVLLVVCWFSVTLVFKPEPISEKTIACIEKKGSEVGRFEALDWKVLGIMAVVFCLWIASNWTGWDATAIAVLALILFFVPGIDVLTWKEYVAAVSWNIVLLIGCVQSISGGVKEQGAASWLFGSTIGKATIGSAAIVAASAALLPLLRLIIPVGPAFIAITLIPLCSIAATIGVSPVVFTVIVAVNASTTFLMGVDGNNMLSYRYGYWKMVDFFKAGIVPTIAMVILHATVLIPLVALAGY